jgi:hypothetical protein
VVTAAPRRNRSALAALICVHLCLSVALLPGCKSAQVAEPLTAELAGNEPEAQMDFWHTLAQRPLTSNDEAFHGLILFLNREDPAESYDNRVAWLQEREMLPKHFQGQAHEAVRRGDLAVAIVHALAIKGGVVLHVLPRSTRYATRELMYLNLYPPSSPNQTFSGAEFVGIIGRMEDYQRVFPTDEAPAKLLPSEAEGAEPQRRGTEEGAAEPSDIEAPATPSGVPTEQMEPVQPGQ